MNCTHRRARGSHVILVSATAALLPVSVATAQLYVPQDLGVLPPFSDSHARDVNNKGEVTGVLTLGADTLRAFIWLPEPAYGLPEGMNDLGILGEGYGYSSGGAINDCGQVVGSTSSSSGSRAFLWESGRMTDLGSLAGDPTVLSSARDINNAGWICGQSGVADPPFHSHAFLCRVACRSTVEHERCYMQDLGTFGGGSCGANAINEKNQIVGAAQLPDSLERHPFFIEPTGPGLVDLGVLPESFMTSAVAINDRGVVIGWMSAKGKERVVMWTRTDGVWTITDLGNPNGHTHTTASAIGNDNIIIGRTFTKDDDQRAFLWKDGVFHDLNDLLVTEENIQLLDANGLNRKGDIAAWGYNAKGETRAFLLHRID